MSGKRLISRRALLTTAGTLAAGTSAGCLVSADGTPTAAKDPWVERTELSDPPGVEGRLRLKRGEYWSYDFVVDKALRMRFTVRSRLSLTFDAMTFSPEDFDAYLAGETADATLFGSVEGSQRAHRQARVPAGEYIFVLDNTRLGESRSFDEVDLFVKLQIGGSEQEQR